MNRLFDLLELIVDNLGSILLGIAAIITAINKKSQSSEPTKDDDQDDNTIRTGALQGLLTLIILSTVYIKERK